MAQRFSSSQLRSKLRQIEQQRRQAINKYNQAARNYNQKLRNAVNKYNQEVNAHNARVRAFQQKVQSELSRLRSRPTTSHTTTYVTYRTSVNTLHQSYVTLEQTAKTQRFGDEYNRILDLSERETANCLSVTNDVFEDDNVANGKEEPENIALLEGLRRISPELDDRWRGAVFALNPKNPDAARHFCTSAREIVTKILDITAPESEVRSVFPDCESTQQGTPTRRARIRFLLQRKQLLKEELEEFIENDMENVVQLFHVFNTGTHGSAGTYNLSQLTSIRTRVEDAIDFLSELGA